MQHLTREQLDAKCRAIRTKIASKVSAMQKELRDLERLARAEAFLAKHSKKAGK